MTIRRPIAILSLFALVVNLSVFAKTNAAPQSFALVSLKHETIGSLTRILVESSAPPLYTVFRPTDRLIVVDLPGGEASQLAPSYSVKSALVDQVVVRQSQPAGSTGGRAVARLEVNVRADARDRSTVNGNTFVLEISPDGRPAPPQDRKDAKAASQPRSDSRADSPGVAVYSAPVSSKNADPRRTEPVAEKVKPQPSALKPATVVRSVRSEASGGGVRVVIDTDGVAQYKDFVLSDPSRIVVDIAGVHSSVGNKTAAVGAASVERLRVGQPSPNVVRVVLDTKSKVPYRVVREGSSLVITVGNFTSFREENTKPSTDAKAQQSSSTEAKAQQSTKTASVDAKSQQSSGSLDTNAQDSAKAVKQAAEPQRKPEVKVAGDRVENKTDQKKPVDQQPNVIAQTNSQSSQSNPPRVTPQPNRSLPIPPATPSSEPKSQAMQPSATRSYLDTQRATQTRRSELAFCDSGYVGGLISFDLRAGVDIRDMLRFISQQYGVNFIVDKSVGPVPVDLRVTDRPWNLVMDSVLRANRLGAVCENSGMIRIATLAAVKEEEDQQAAIRKAQADREPLVTKIIHLKYARAAGQLGASGAGASGRGASSSGGSSSSGGGGGGGGFSGQGSLTSIVNSRLSPRGRSEVDVRTNSLIVTDLPQNLQVIEGVIAELDHPEPQVEIEARIVIANRNFLRDIGSELAAANVGKNGRGGLFETTPVQLVGTGLQPGGSSGGAGGSSGGSSGGSGSGSGGSGSGSQKGLGPNLVGPFADTSLRAGIANTVLSLTTGALGTGLLSMALSASETKGQVRTIASPRVTTTDNKTAEIVNGVQIPVQTVSNNTITTTFVTAALRLEITPQIIEENGQVLMHVVAENNTVNFQLANQFNNGTPGINTQSAESTVLVQDGGTTVMGGINIDSEGHSINRTPGLSRIPLMGEMFKHRSTRRDTDEILFFLTPRIVRNDGTLGPRAPQRSSVEGMPNPNETQRAVAPTSGASDNKAATATAGGTGGKSGH